MHSTTLAIFLLSLFLAVSLSTAAQNNTNQACTQCWINARNNLSECKNISATEAGAFKKATDAQLTSDSSSFKTVLPCLCALSNNAESILSACAQNCVGDFFQGLKTEAVIVGKEICGVNKLIANSTSDPSSQSGQTPVTTAVESDPTANTASYNSGASLITPGSGPLLSLAIVLVAAVMLTF